MEFFPAGSLDARPDLHAFDDRWFVSHLLVMQEEPLIPPHPDQPTTYRLIYLPSWFSSCVVRLIAVGSSWKAVCKRADRDAYNEPRQLVAQAEKELSRVEAKRLTKLLTRVNFWDMPSFDNDVGCDGFTAVLEGVRAGHYHVVHRWTPRGTPYAELVDFLVELFQPPPKPPKFVGSFAELADRLRPRRGGSGPAQ